MLTAVLSLIAVLLPGALTDELADGPAVQVLEKYYDVTGTTAKELREAVRKAGPQGRFAGYTEWQISWSYTAKPADGRWAVASVATKLVVTVTMPRWTNSADASDDLRLSWSLSLRDLRKHEEIHIDDARATAKAVEAAIRALPPAAGRAALDADVQRVAMAEVDEGRRKDAADDLRTLHGAVSRPPALGGPE